MNATSGDPYSSISCPPAHKKADILQMPKKCRVGMVAIWGCGRNRMGYYASSTNSLGGGHMSGTYSPRRSRSSLLPMACRRSGLLRVFPETCYAFYSSCVCILESRLAPIWVPHGDLFKY